MIKAKPRKIKTSIKMNTSKQNKLQNTMLWNGVWSTSRQVLIVVDIYVLVYTLHLY